MKKIIHHPHKCIGCLACVGLAPTLFESDPETGLARLVDGLPQGETFVRTITNEQDTDLLTAACAGAAIEITDDNEN